MAGFVVLIWVGREADYFRKGDWTTQITLDPLEEIAVFAQRALAEFGMFRSVLTHALVTAYFGPRFPNSGVAHAA